MELLFVGVFALLLFCFGGALAALALNFGLLIGDRMLTAFGSACKWFLINLGRGLAWSIRYAFKRMGNSQSDMTVRPFFVSAVELPHLIHSNKRVPVEIEYPQPKKGG